MWNSTAGGFDSGYGGGNDGGFMNSQNQFASPGGQDQKKARHSQNLVPVTIKNIIDFEGDNLLIAGMEVHMVDVVGLIRAVDITSTRITYTIDDHTATIEAVQWQEPEQGSDDPARGSLMEMTYCRVSGAIRSQMGKRHIIVFRIAPITDINLITTHILEVIHCVLKLQHLNSLGGDTGPSHPAVMSNSLVGASGLDGGAKTTNMGGMNMQGLNAQQRMVFQAIYQSSDEGGAGRENIYSILKGKLSPPQIDQALEFLSSEGHVYTTIDDDHFRAIES
nr:replication protein A 32 kDa subunit-A-like [Cherax quadricarinatus]